MVIQTADGWILDVAQDYSTGNITLLIKLQDSKVISFKQKIKEHTFYVHPKSSSAGEDLYQQLSRNDEIIRKIFWDNKYTELSNRNETRLIGISVTDMNSQDFRAFIKKLRMDLRVRSLYNVELSATQYFIYNKLKIAPTSKVIIEYEDEELLSVKKVEDSQDATLPPFKLMHIRISGGSEPKLNVLFDNQAPVIFTGSSDENFGSYINENKPDIAIVYAEYRQDRSILTSVRTLIAEQSSRTVVVRTRYTIEDISLVEIVDKARFSYLSLQLASTYGMLKLIDSRITYELIRRNFVIPKLNTVSKHHEEIRTLENIIEMDKAGMIISPQIGLHENVAVLDFNDEYANIIIGHNISYENLSSDNSTVRVVKI